MTIVLAIGFVVELALSIYLLKVVHRHEIDIFNREFKIEALQRKIDGYKDSVEVLSTSVRKLNEGVKDLEQKQPKIEPKNRMNTRAFIAGWDADEPEESELLSDIEARTRMAVMDMLRCQNLNPFAQQGIIDNLNCRNIYPWQTGQLQLCATHPLWYINRRLEDM